jgi:hypothetical protein
MPTMLALNTAKCACSQVHAGQSLAEHNAAIGMVVEHSEAWCYGCVQALLSVRTHDTAAMTRLGRMSVPSSTQ